MGVSGKRCAAARGFVKFAQTYVLGVGPGDSVESSVRPKRRETGGDRDRDHALAFQVQLSGGYPPLPFHGPDSLIQGERPREVDVTGMVVGAGHAGIMLSWVSLRRT